MGYVSLQEGNFLIDGGVMANFQAFCIRNGTPHLRIRVRQILLNPEVPVVGEPTWEGKGMESGKLCRSWMTPTFFKCDFIMTPLENWWFGIGLVDVTFYRFCAHEKLTVLERHIFCKAQRSRCTVALKMVRKDWTLRGGCGTTFFDAFLWY